MGQVMNEELKRQALSFLDKEDDDEYEALAEEDKEPPKEEPYDLREDFCYEP